MLFSEETKEQTALFEKACFAAMDALKLAGHLETECITSVVKRLIILCAHRDGVCPVQYAISVTQQLIAVHGDLHEAMDQANALETASPHKA